VADDKKFSEWHGVPRDKIKWNPTVDKNKCIGCGMCITGCGRNVYDWDSKENKSVVARPNNCLVGCVTCSNTCLFGAISFPDKEELRKIIIENGVIARAKKELGKKLEETAEKPPAPTSMAVKDKESELNAPQSGPITKKTE